MNPAKKNEFDRQLADKFHSFHPEVPSGLWGKIAATLDEQERNGIVPIKQRRRLPTWWISVAASVLVVCGIVYWYYRPAAVTYLQKPVVHTEETVPPVEEGPTPTPATAVEPLDIDRLKRLFAKRGRKSTSNPKPEIHVDEALSAALAVATTNNQPATVEPTPTPTPAGVEDEAFVTPLPTGQPAVEQAVAATIPDIQPPVVSEDEEETLLAATEAPKQPFGVSNILNYVVGAVDQREEKLVTFSSDDEGSLTLDFNFSLAKNKKKRIK